MALKNHCLFCLERTVPYSVLSKIGESFGVEIIGDDVREEDVPTDFQSLCKYLKLSLPKKKTGYGASVLSSSCDKFLCISCFEMVERLKELYKELTGIKRRIREVILAHDISTNLSSTSRMRREEFEKEVRSHGSQEKDCLAFVEMFQTLVKGLDLEDSAVSADTDDKAADKSIVETDELEMKIELDEEDRNNFGGEGDPLFTDPHNNDMFGSPLDNTNDEHPFETSEMESEIRTEYEDDAEQKPEIMTDITGKKKYKKRQWQTSAGTDSVSSRTRKSPRLRQTLPEPSSSPSHTIKIEPLQQFKCADCDLSFTSYYKRSEHRRKLHPLNLSTLKSLIASIPMVPHIRRIPGGLNRGHNRKRTYICTICGQHVNERNPNTLLNYMEHMLSHDEHANKEKAGPHSCTNCDQQFNLKINLDLHVACIHDARKHVIRCNVCTENVNYGTREALIQHLKSTHGDTVYTCKHCPMAHVSFEKLLFHMLKHIRCRRLICPECDAVSTTMSELHEHCAQVHPELKETYNCERCDKVYHEKGPLRNHMEVEHGFDPKSNTFKRAISLVCPQCKSKGKNKIFKTQAALRNHIRIHREKIHKCDQCEDKCFGSKSALRKHVETFHEKIRYPCPYCTNSYSVPSALNDHLKTHTGEGLLICEVCSKEFPSERRLKRHMGSHATFASEEKLACEDCGKEFPGQYKLMRHKRNAHPKEKKACPVCGMEFNRSDNLRSHMRRHSGYRPYQCPACNQSFNRRDILKAHVNGVHGMEVEEAEKKT